MAFTLQQIQRGALRSARNRVQRYTRDAVTPPRHLQPGPQDRLETVLLHLSVSVQALAWPATLAPSDQTGAAVFVVPVGSVFVVTALAATVFSSSCPYEPVIELGGTAQQSKGAGVVTDTTATPRTFFGSVCSRCLSAPRSLPVPFSVYGNGKLALGARRWYTSAAAASTGGYQYEPRLTISALITGFLTVPSGEVYS